MSDELPKNDLVELFASDDLGARIVIDQEKTHLHAGIAEHLTRVLEGLDKASMVPSETGAVVINTEISETLPCYCVEVTSADVIKMGYRGDRAYTSPIVQDREPIQTNELTLVLLPIQELDQSKKTYIIATAYTGGVVPLEVTSPQIKDKLVSEAVIGASNDFWLNPDGSWKHALVPEPGLSIRYAEPAARPANS